MIRLFSPRCDERSTSFLPTEAPPGSPEKVAILAERLRRGLPLWHPADANGVISTEAALLRQRVLAGIQWGLL